MTLAGDGSGGKQLEQADWVQVVIVAGIGSVLEWLGERALLAAAGRRRPPIRCQIGAWPPPQPSFWVARILLVLRMTSGQEGRTCLAQDATGKGWPSHGGGCRLSYVPPSLLCDSRRSCSSIPQISTTTACWTPHSKMSSSRTRPATGALHN